MKTKLFFIYAFLSLLATIPNLIKLESKKRALSDEDYMDFCTEVTRGFAVKQVNFTGSKFNIFGKENIPKDKAVLFVANHQSYFDLGFFIGYVEKPKGYVAKIEVGKLPIVKKWMQELKCVFMDRSDMKKSVQAIIEGVNILKNGHSLVIFPEGTRSRSNNIGEFKAGSFKLATKSKVPIVPVTIDGTYKIFEGNNNKIKPAEVNFYIHPPIYTKDLSREELAVLHDKVFEIVASKLEK